MHSPESSETMELANKFIHPSIENSNPLLVDIKKWDVGIKKLNKLIAI